MKNWIFVIFGALAFATYSIPFTKTSKWNASLPLMIIGGALIYVLYMAVFEKVNYLQKAPYQASHLAVYLPIAMLIYAVGFMTFGKLLSGPPEKVQLYVSLCTALIPVFALVVPAILNRQMISVTQCIGLILVVAGVIIINKD